MSELLIWISVGSFVVAFAAWLVRRCVDSHLGYFEFLRNLEAREQRDRADLETQQLAIAIEHEETRRRVDAQMAELERTLASAIPPIPSMPEAARRGYATAGEWQVTSIERHVTTGQGQRGEYQVPQRLRLPSSVKVAYTSRELFAWQADMRTHDLGVQQVLNAVLAGARQLSGNPALQHRDLQYTINFASPTGTNSQRYSVRLREPAAIAGVYDLMQVVDPETFIPRWQFGDFQFAIENAAAAVEVRPGRDLSEPDPELGIPEPLPVPTPREGRVIELD